MICPTMGHKTNLTSWAALDVIEPFLLVTQYAVVPLPDRVCVAGPLYPFLSLYLSVFQEVNKPCATSLHAAHASLGGY